MNFCFVIHLRKLLQRLERCFCVPAPGCGDIRNNGSRSLSRAFVVDLGKPQIWNHPLIANL